MKSLLRKLPHQSSSASPSSQIPLSLLPPPSSTDILTHRTHHGTNLGGIFVLEKWLFPSLFPGPTNRSSELDFLTSTTHNLGLRSTREKLEAHWAGSVTDALLDELAKAGVTTVRLPLGFWTLGPQFCQNTPFEPYASVYMHAWGFVGEVCRRSKERGLGVLLDLHALPGNANGRDHGGTGDGVAGFWEDTDRGVSWRPGGREAVKFLMGEVVEEKVKGVVGVQVINEAPHWSWERDGEGGLGGWYESVLKDLEKEGLSGVPVYVSDGWDTQRAVDWSRKYNRVDIEREAGNGGKGYVAGVVVATSKYFCFSDADKAAPARGLIENIEKEAEGIEKMGGNVTDHGAGQVVVTEWSCGLHPTSFAGCDDHKQVEVRKRFGATQARLWREKVGGAFYWTGKTEGGEGEWDFGDMVQKGHVRAPEHASWGFEEVGRRVQVAGEGSERLMKEVLGAHVGYWDGVTPVERRWGHWRFEAGWRQGWEDAVGFFDSRSKSQERFPKAERKGCDTVGLLDLWILKRMREAGQNEGLAWEWEHGFRQGVKNAEELLLRG
ncbi:uncharacterized protein KY384_000922 [Bacidia gigantensis]|uniref:uncharacterized protein n=1 Tax=Bacidia gigantensis TaxID=2732470 RepID=UPI001D038201|nr:uncharacterized protein KY384_000922 [Bacidia gigantensis]KAG8534079.1 hypothetical protein KY384_000922 [Bacidia gigantensis]